MRWTGRAWRAAGAALLLSLCAPSVRALDPTRQLTQYVRDVWRSEQGLPQNSVLALCQTRDGYLWIGTQEGLVRFDGVRFTVFDKGNTPALTYNYVSALAEDHDGSLWIGLRGGGLVRLKDGLFQAFSTRQGLADDRVRALHVDREGALWIGTSGGGLVRHRAGGFTTFTTRQGLTSDQVVSILEDRAGSLWIGTFGGGVVRLRQGVFTAFTTRQGLSHDEVSSIVEGGDGSLWIGTFGGGVNRMRDGAFTAFTTREGLPSNEVWSLREDGAGSLWIGTDQGLARLRDGRVDVLTSKEGLSQDDVVSLLEDREGSLWVGTFQGGLDRLRDGAFATLGAREGLSADVVQSVYQDRHGAIWIGTGGGGLDRLDAGAITSYGTRQGLKGASVMSLVEDQEGALWVGTYDGGLARLRDGRFTTFTTRDGLARNIVMALAVDPAGALWIGTDGGGVDRWRAGRITHEAPFTDRITSLHAAADGTVWVGTAGGLRRLSNRLLTTFTTRDGLSDDRIDALHEDLDGTLWIGTAGGLTRMRQGAFTRVTQKDGLHDDRVFAVLDDSLGNLWMSSNRGVFRVRRSDVDAFAAGREQRVASVAYGTADGMRSSECNGESQPAAWRTRDGRLWFATIAGVAVVDPAHLPTNTVPPPVGIEEVVIDGRRLPAGGPLVVPPGTQKLDLRYTATSLRNPARVRFRYRLEGFDRDWVDAGTERTAHYTGLAPGSYTFRVKACNDDGVWNETGASLDLSLQPWFHQTRAFQGLSVLAAFLLAAGAHRLRLRRLRARARELETIVAEQTRDLRAANLDLQRAQDQLARLSAASPEKLENVSAWGSSMADEVGRAIHAHRIHLWRAEGEHLVPLSPTAMAAPSWEAVQAARTQTTPSPGASTLVPVMGPTHEIRGALVIEGPVAWGDQERRLVGALAEHLGSALDLQHLREQLTTTEARQKAARQRMREQGISTVLICPRCGRCADDTTELCPEDGEALDGSRLLPLRILGRYRLARLLGEGGMGSVFEAEDERLQRAVALKVIRTDMLTDPEARFRFEREAKALARIRHPSVVGLFDSGELEDGSAFLVMELLHGTDLSALLREHGPGTPAQVAVLLRQVAPALAAAHGSGVIHRDIKPANILLSPAGNGFRCTVLDFGLARSMRTDQSLTQSGMLVGTPAYMSPEQVEGATLDARSDLYSLAAVAYEALLGRALVPAQDVTRMLVDVLYGAPPAPSRQDPGLPPEVDEAFLRALAKKPAERPADLEAWAFGLAVLLDRLPARGRAGWPDPGAAGARSRTPPPLPGPTVRLR